MHVLSLVVALASIGLLNDYLALRGNCASYIDHSGPP
jgi:hypothetical protein